MGNPLLDRRSPKELAASEQVIDFSMKISDFGLSAIQFIGYFIIGPQILENIVNMRKKINERMSFVV